VWGLRVAMAPMPRVSTVTDRLSSFFRAASALRMMAAGSGAADAGGCSSWASAQGAMPRRSNEEMMVRRRTITASFPPIVTAGGGRGSKVPKRGRAAAVRPSNASLPPLHPLEPPGGLDDHLVGFGQEQAVVDHAGDVVQSAGEFVHIPVF